jgi:protein gp37
MGNTTAIAWTEKTWNPWQGCTKVSDGCKYCYMYRDKERYGQDPKVVVRSSKSTFNKPLNWKEPALVFTCSWSDFFHEAADEFRAEAWQIIKRTPHLTYQVLTKRPERIMQCLPPDWGEGYPNVWLGTTVENQAAVHRIATLSEVPAKIRFISFEPLIGPITDKFVSNEIHWVIIGGESGNDTGKYRYRECKLEWIEGLVSTFDWAIGRFMPNEAAVFVKQLGTHLSKELKLTDRAGANPDEWPEHLRIQDFPVALPDAV